MYAKDVSSPILVCICRFIVWKFLNGLVFEKLAPLLLEFFNRLHGHVVQSGMRRETLKVNPILHRTAAEAAIVLF